MPVSPTTSCFVVEVATNEFVALESISIILVHATMEVRVHMTTICMFVVDCIKRLIGAQIAITVERVEDAVTQGLSVVQSSVSALLGNLLTSTMGVARAVLLDNTKIRLAVAVARSALLEPTKTRQARQPVRHAQRVLTTPTQALLRFQLVCLVPQENTRTKPAKAPAKPVPLER